jgi:hypothetical protein
MDVFEIGRHVGTLSWQMSWDTQLAKQRMSGACACLDGEPVNWLVSSISMYYTLFDSVQFGFGFWTRVGLVVVGHLSLSYFFVCKFIHL